MHDSAPGRRAAAPPRRDSLGDDRRVAHNRVRFLKSEPVEADQVRDVILSSWGRSRRLHVPADRIDLPYTRDQDLDTPLIHGAAPILDRLGEALDGQPISLILTDAAGVVLTQHTGDADLQRHLESVDLLPGFSYGESFVGTNGIGTALADARPTHVFGHEHYAEHLEGLACAGAPVQHPITGKVIGAVDLTCWRKDAGRLLVALARTTSEQVRQALLARSSTSELALFESYLQACRRTTGIVIAFNDAFVMTNSAGHRLLGPADQEALLVRAREALRDRGRGNAVVTLPTGNKVRMRCHRASGDGRRVVAGCVLTVRSIEGDDEPAGAPSVNVPMFLPGIAGSAPAWARCCHQVDAHYREGDRLVLAGEPGTGKSALVHAVHRRHNPAGRLRAVDADEPRCIERLRYVLLEDPPDTLLIRHVDRLGAAALTALAGLVRHTAERRGTHRRWISITVGPEPETRPELAELLALFPHTVQVPPLRRHIEDLGELVPLLLSTLSRGNRLTCSAPAMHLLMRAPWPGNVTQLCQALKAVAKRRRAGTISPEDLPPEYRTAGRRVLNRLESLERDAIIQSLEDAGGNKSKAAQALGMSRATIYRKIHDYGIVVPDKSRPRR